MHSNHFSDIVDRDRVYDNPHSPTFHNPLPLAHFQQATGQIEGADVSKTDVAKD